MISFAVSSCLLFIVFHCVISEPYSELTEELGKYFVNGNSELKAKCLKDPDCSFVKEGDSAVECVGFEHGCSMNNSYSNGKISCNIPGKWSGDKRYQLEQFWKQGDFGYVKDRSILHEICRETTEGKESSTVLHCSDNLRHCWAKNIFFDFQNLKIRTSKRYREDVIQKGQVGGNCHQFHGDVIRNNLEHKGYLQSWAHELEHFKSYPDFEVNNEHCDVIFERPTVIMKLDASINMYHHFCDFLNLFASQFINGTFERDIDIIWWDTHPGGFVDAMFGETWKVFSTRKPIELASLDGKKVCFRNVLMPMLARQRFGLFYNSALMAGCSGTGLFHSFSHHILNRLKIEQKGPILDTVRVTILSRSTPFRKILNEEELLSSLGSLPNVEARLVDYNARIPFVDQLHSTHNTDIFIGMHGSGLTHLLFLPDWAAVFEIYNCEDENCYLDLARLRGVKYWTWQKNNLLFPDSPGRHPTNGGEHKKFANYAFDKTEFTRIAQQMVDYVRRHPKFVSEQRRLRRLKKASAEL